MPINTANSKLDSFKVVLASQSGGCRGSAFVGAIKEAYKLVKWNRVKSIKTIHSRSNKDIGDVIEEEWEITAKRVIAEPRTGGSGQIPRFGIYEYEVKPIIRRAVDKATFAKQQNEPGVGGTRREASSVPLTVRRTS